MSAVPFPRLARKPPSAEGTGEPRAHRRDVENSPLKRTACQVYGALCDCLDHSRYTGLVWPKSETLARRLHITVRTVQRGLEELVSAGWVGTPCGDSGGSREGVLYHLHPNGTPCLFCLAAARTLNQRCKPSAPESTGDNSSPVQMAQDFQRIPLRGDKSSPIPRTTGDILAATGDKNADAYKERRFLMSSSKSSTTTDDLPAEFVDQMDQETPLDRGALLRLWRTAREIVPDATGDEIRHFFHLRAMSVYRNRKVENPTGLMLSTIPDWFEPRRVLAQRTEIREATTQLEAIRMELREMGIASTDCRKAEATTFENGQSIRDQVANATSRKGL
jgi:hypothetical protein